MTVERGGIAGTRGVRIRQGDREGAMNMGGRGRGWDKTRVMGRREQTWHWYPAHHTSAHANARVAGCCRM